MSKHRNICVSVPIEVYEAVYAVAEREGLSGAAAFARRAIRRDLGAFTEEISCLRQYDDIEMLIPPNEPLARFALPAFPAMEDCEHAGCERCNHFLRQLCPDLVLSTDTFELLPEEEPIGVILKRTENP